VLASVAGDPNAHTFTRTSYCLAPASWRELDEDELSGRLETVLLAGYAKRNHTLRGTDDPTPMQLISWDCEWVPSEAIAQRPWTRAFQAFRISADGREWHIVKYHEVDALFDQHLLGALHVAQAVSSAR
jgi:hypothetical protein